ncbi:MAG: GNAT family N-acetyltransferase [Polyangia bacterium]
MDIATLETPRLRLVPPSEKHLVAYAALYADARFVRSLELEPLDRTAAHRNLAAALGHWHLRGWGTWLVEDRASGALLGRVGIHDWIDWPEPELGWAIAPPAWGRGYAVEAARAVLAATWRVHRRARLVSLVRPSNVASIRVAEKLGAVHERDHESVHGAPMRVYVHALSDDLT